MLNMNPVSEEQYYWYSRLANATEDYHRAQSTETACGIFDVSMSRVGDSNADLYAQLEREVLDGFHISRFKTVTVRFLSSNLSCLSGKPLQGRRCENFGHVDRYSFFDQVHHSRGTRCRTGCSGDVVTRGTCPHSRLLVQNDVVASSIHLCT